MAAGFASMRLELLWAFVLSLGAATILAIGCAIYIMRLEKETRLRYDQVAAGRTELESYPNVLWPLRSRKGSPFHENCTTRWDRHLTPCSSMPETSKSAFRKAMRRAGNSWTRSGGLPTPASMKSAISLSCCGLRCWMTWV